MNLVETLMGGVIFGLASMGSLQIYGSSLQATYGNDQRQDHDAAMDLILATVHQSLSSQAAGPSSGDAGDSPACAATVMKMLGDALVNHASSADVTFELSQHDGLLRLMVLGVDQPPRQRWFSPAAYGLCGNPLGATTSDHDAETPESDGLHTDRSPDGSQPAGSVDGVGVALEPGAMGPAAGGDGGTAVDGGAGARP